ncbi:hypothetical protein HNQ85_003318 [Anoxybacillus calidus]|uniref:histidine kinase n=1 Tax=[Anoxybacillus] calidus TaxID=575178 RepID=A0A7V9Z2Q4_9BACL|nr:HAMP domain-containing sensor histidine kinase [Anoxybacillus calidus]MBA2873003.1 hypothetical protein [Anoxybacillus calidus]
MKWKITLLYIASIIGLLLTVLIVQVAIVTYFVFHNNKLNHQESSPEEITLNLKKQIQWMNGNFYLTKKGEHILTHNKAWMQIVDTNGNVVYNAHTPKNVKQHYTAKDIVFLYKYSVDGYTIFVSELEKNNEKWSYIVAFPYQRVSRFLIYLNINNMFSLYPYGILMLVIAAILCVLIFAYGVAKYMARPVWMLMDNITNLSKGIYEQKSVNKGIYKDVFASLKQLSTNLQELDKKRKQLDKMREEWITNLTHDLKTPLSSIKGYSELLADKNYHFTTEERAKYAKIIESKSLYIEKLIDDLKLTYQLKNDILPLNKKDTDIIKILRDLIISYVNNPAYQDKNIEFIANSTSLILKIDEKLIQRALNNIIINAIVHNSSGTHIKVDVKDDKHAVYIFVEDNGRGIPEEELEHLFDRYFRGSNTKNIEGSGLGLAIAKQIINAHNGEIHVQSKWGKGTTTTVVLKKRIN